MSRFANLSRSQLRSRAKLFTALWLSWLFVGNSIASLVPHRLEIPLMLVAMVPFVLAGRFGMELWFRAKTAPELPRASAHHVRSPEGAADRACRELRESSTLCRGRGDRFRRDR